MTIHIHFSLHVQLLYILHFIPLTYSALPFAVTVAFYTDNGLDYFFCCVCMCIKYTSDLSSIRNVLNLVPFFLSTLLRKPTPDEPKNNHPRHPAQERNHKGIPTQYHVERWVGCKHFIHRQTRKRLGRHTYAFFLTCVHPPHYVLEV